MKKLFLLCIMLSIFMLGCSKAAEGDKGEFKDNSLATIEEDKTEHVADGNPVSATLLEDLELKDVYGNKHDEKLFKDNKLTVLNLWGTFCGPCIEEMPDLEKISNEYSDKRVRVVGLVIDNPSEEDAKKMLEELGVTYTNIYPDDKLNELITSKFDYVPVTLFIDSDGKVLNTFIAGSEDKEVFKRTIDKLLEEK